MPDVIPELEELVARFRAGEAEIAAAFFATPRPLEQHLSWLRFQIAREARNLEEIASHQRCRLVEDVEASVSREQLVEQFLEDYQELRHYAMLAYLYEGIGGEPVQWRALRETAKQAPWYALSRQEHARWAELRQHGTLLEYAAALFTRGGGGALFYGFIPLQGGDYEWLLSQAAQIILRDELEHGASEGRDELYKHIHSRADIDTAKRIIAEMSRLRLAMRNEQFACVLSPQRLEAIANGDIAPLTTEAMLQACQGTEDWFAAYHARPKPLSSASIA